MRKTHLCVDGFDNLECPVYHNGSHSEEYNQNANEVHLARLNATWDTQKHESVHSDTEKTKHDKKTSMILFCTLLKYDYKRIPPLSIVTNPYNTYLIYMTQMRSNRTPLGSTDVCFEKNTLHKT